MSCGFSSYGSCGGAYRRRGYVYSCSDGSDTYITCGGEVHYGGRYPANYFVSGGCGRTYRRRGYVYSCSDGSDTYITCGGEVHYGGRYPANYFVSGGCGRTYEDYSTGCGSGSCGG